MANPDLLTKLYQRMNADQEQYRNWLLGQPPGVILGHAAEYTIREDIVMKMEERQMELVLPRDRRQDGPGLSYQSPGLFFYPSGGGPSGEITEWKEDMIRQLVDTVRVLFSDRIRVCLRGGMEIEQAIQGGR